MANKKYIKTPTHVRQVLSTQINILREMNVRTNEDKIKRAKAIAYISSIVLTSIREGELEERIQALEELKER